MSVLLIWNTNSTHKAAGLLSCSPSTKQNLNNTDSSDTVSKDFSLLNWIGHGNRMDSKNKACQVFNNNPQGSQLRGRPKNRQWNCVQTDIKKCKITNWNERSKNRGDWEKSILEAKVRIGMQCQQRSSRYQRFYMIYALAYISQCSQLMTSTME
jgi:hypothetical protein